MNKILITFFTVLFCMTSSVGWSETLSLKDLVKRDGIFYKKFSDKPFTGKVKDKRYYKNSNKTQRFFFMENSFVNGLRDGVWRQYWDNGQLWLKENYKNGKKEGSYIQYHENGKLNTNSNYKNGKPDGTWVYYWDNEKIRTKGNYKNGKLEGEWVEYSFEGQLKYKGHYKNNKKDGYWVYYDYDGTIHKGLTGMWKDGEPISD